jgi:predicted GIY-YIG superfamily endonuclease
LGGVLDIDLETVGNKMTILRSGVATATTIAALCFNVGPNLVAAPLNMKSEAEHTTVSASYVASSAKADEFSRRESSAFAGEEVNAEAPETQQANSENFASNQAAPLDAFGYLGGLFEARFYQAHATTDDPRDEIREAASLYGVDAVMMMSIAKVESDFNPRVRTGSYKGLFQLSDHEFNKYGDGSIWDARDNARAAAHMFLVQAEQFRWALGHYPDFAERYMVHQQGIQGAIEHYIHPERIAWQSMCATDEGVLKGEQWCKRCIWGNLLPEWKRAFGNVDDIQSGQFVAMWTARIDHFADRYSVASADAVAGATPKDDARGLTAVPSSSVRSLRSHASHLRARVALAWRRHSRLSPVKTPAHSSVERRPRRA